MKLRKQTSRKKPRMRKRVESRSTDPRVTHRPLNKEEKMAKQRKCLELRVKGFSIQEICEIMNLGHITVSKYIRELLEEENRRMFLNVQEYRRLEAYRLDSMIKGIIGRATEGLPVEDKDGNYIKDSKGNYILKTDLKAIDRVLKIMERRSKFFGLDEPVENIIKGDPNAPLSLQVVDEESRKVLSKLEEMVKRVEEEKK